MEPFQVIGNYVPRNVFNSNMFNMLWGVRPTYENKSIAVDYGEHVNGWHTDNQGKTRSILLWSDTYPTEILLPNGNIVSGRPNDIVLIDNHAVKHRVPNAYVKRVRSGSYVPRNFARCFVSFSEVSPYEIERWRYALKHMNNAS